MSNPFGDILTQPPSHGQPSHPSLKTLDEFVDAIRSYRPTALDCELMLGHPTNWGQEYRVVLISRRSGYEYTLLRAYVPPVSGQTRVDFYDFQLREYPDAPQLEAGLKEFLARPATRTVIDEYAK